MKNLIFDIGANAGDFTQICLNKIPDSEIVAVEPNKNLVDLLHKRFNSNSVTILDYLVSDKDDEYVPFYESTTHVISTASTNWINNSRFSKNYTWSSPIQKKTITIDKMIALYGNPDLIKIDVEGYEFQALQGLTKKNNKLCFEWAEEEKESTIQCCNYLKVIGYEKFGYILGDEHLKEPEEWFDADKLIQKMNMQPSRKVEWGMVWAK